MLPAVIDETGSVVGGRFEIGWEDRKHFWHGNVSPVGEEDRLVWGEVRSFQVLGTVHESETSPGPR